MGSTPGRIEFQVKVKKNFPCWPQKSVFGGFSRPGNHSRSQLIITARLAPFEFFFVRSTRSDGSREHRLGTLAPAMSSTVTAAWATHHQSRTLTCSCRQGPDTSRTRSSRTGLRRSRPDATKMANRPCALSTSSWL